MEKKGAPINAQQSSRNPRTLLTSDDNPIVKKVQETHGPENHEVDMKPLLDMIEVIINLCNGVPGEYPLQSQEEMPNDKNLGSMPKVLADKIISISSEILGNYFGGQDAQETILAIFSTLSPFSWNAKGAIALAAFAVNYGEVCLIAQLYKSDPIVKSLALLEQLPDVLNRFESSTMKIHMAELTNEMLVLTKCICDFKDLPEEFIKSKAKEVVDAEAQIPSAIYWIIRSSVICQSLITNLTGAGYENVTSNAESWELSFLVDKVNQLCSHLKQQLELCHQRVEKDRVKEIYQKIVNLLDITHDDNIEILRILMGNQEDVLFNGLTKTPASAELLRKKTVLFYISGLDFPKAELSALRKIYCSSQQKTKEISGEYDVVWIPIVGKSWNEAQQKQLEAIRDRMPWFSLRQPWLLDTAVIEYIKNVWHFEKTSVLVTLNQKGKIVNFNAIHMMLIWDNMAYPFTSSREEQLWAAQTWRLELLVGGIEPSVNKWIAEGKYVCLYGGEDLEWIRKFTTAAVSVAKRARIPFEMLYMGTSNPKEKVAENNAIIAAEKLSNVVQDLDQIWLFWSRLHSMWNSRVQRGMSPETDRIIREIFVMRSFECSERGWAIISRGSYEMTKAMGDTMLNCLYEFDQWEKNVAGKGGFVGALNEYIHQQQTDENLQGCNKLEWPLGAGIPEKMVCFECGRLMMKNVTFVCGER